MWLNKVRESGNISRFHTRNTVYSQSIAEHSFNVAFIAMELMQGIEDINQKRVIQYSLLHDTAEAFTGDVVGNLKQQDKVLKERLDSHERAWFKENVPGHLQNALIYISYKEKLLVKLADLMDALVVSLTEVRLGNMTLKSAVDNIWRNLYHKMIEADSFDKRLGSNAEEILIDIEKEFDEQLKKCVDWDKFEKGDKA